jgi:ABC-type nitrate/sulfonate/bicarbonate transport system substrate-binding protein
MRRETRVRRLYAALAAAGMIACVAGSVGSAHAQTNIIEGFVSHGALQWPEYIAAEFGWFKDNGVTVDMVVVGPGAAVGG